MTHVEVDEIVRLDAGRSAVRARLRVDAAKQLLLLVPVRTNYLLLPDAVELLDMFHVHESGAVPATIELQYLPSGVELRRKIGSIDPRSSRQGDAAVVE